MFTVRSSMLVVRSPKMGRRSGMARTVDLRACQTPTAHLSYATWAGQRDRNLRSHFQGRAYYLLDLKQDTSMRRVNEPSRIQAGRPAVLGSAASVAGQAPKQHRMKVCFVASAANKV